ncbi:ABC transporter permease subunit [Oscillibacter sp. MCC667]|uniref:Iron ABC transporter permease n=1 Tax=Flintibacter faecis TaxID=2763047 RepID=A0A8J6MBI2_9FIRM|nr:iron ABC transporter permease [Flintibacter faecis]MBC5717900.1 iron ABC transporter permease [Flintibacter faecis]MBT9650829.1 ABC transporter permease subunit [Oscillibacter sp. MCC667]
MRYAGEKRFNVWTALTLILLALFLLFVIYPIGMLIVKSLFVGGKVDLSYFVKFFSKKYYWVTLVNSFKVTVLSTLLACLIGVPMAYLLRSVKIRGSEFLNILIVISYLSPPFIGAYAWIQLLGRNGFITRILNALFHVKLHGIYGFAGIVLVFSLQSFPLIYMYVSGAMKNLDNSLNEAAESLGCNAFQRVTKVIFPLVLPSLLAGMLLVFMRVFSDFGTPMIIGEGYKTFPVMLYTQFMGEVGTNDGFAATMCVIVIVIALMFFFIQKLLGQKFTYSMTALKPMQAQEAEGWRKVCAHLAVYLVTLVAALPQITVIITSFIGTINGSLFTGEFTLDNYRNIFSKGNTVAIRNTYLFGLEAIVVVIVCGILISYLSVRKKNTLTGVLDVLTMFPYIIPGSVLGISFLYAFNGPPFLLGGTVIIMIIALSIRRMPYTIRSSTAIIGQISPSIEEASISLGASQVKTFLQITVPMMLPGVLSGAIMSWITLISELSSSVILYTSRTSTLTVAIYSEVIRSNFGNAAAYSTILTLTSIVSLLIFFKVSGSKDLSV